jgi:hypothetical protein
LVHSTISLNTLPSDLLFSKHYSIYSYRQKRNPQQFGWLFQSKAPQAGLEPATKRIQAQIQLGYKSTLF